MLNVSGKVQPHWLTKVEILCHLLMKIGNYSFVAVKIYSENVEKLMFYCQFKQLERRETYIDNVKNMLLVI